MVAQYAPVPPEEQAAVVLTLLQWDCVNFSILWTMNILFLVNKLSHCTSKLWLSRAKGMHIRQSYDGHYAIFEDHSLSCCVHDSCHWYEVVRRKLHQLVYMLYCYQ
jgi:hypothetical protein